MSVDLSALKAASSEQLLKLIDRRHPEFKENLDHWRFLEACYRGGRSWIEKNLFTYPKEGRKEFAERKKRAYRFPHSKEVVGLVNKYVFKGAIARSEELPPAVKEFWGAATLLKRPICDLMESIAKWSSTFGRLWVVVDNSIPADVVTEADRKAAKGRIYAYFIKPMQAYDYAFDEDGELEWFMNGEFARDDANPLTSSGDVTEQFRLWTKDFTAVIKVAKKGRERTAELDLASVREHGLGIVPIFPADHITSDELYKVDGLVEDVAYMDRTVANYLSCLDVIVTDQTFSQLAIPFQGMLPTEGGAGDDSDIDQDQMSNMQVMGTKRVFGYNAEGGAAPTYISPDVSQPELILKAVTKIVGEIYHSIGMAGERTKEDNATGIDNSSGVAKAYDFEKINAMLAAKARSLQNVEHNLVRLVNAWSGDVEELQDTEELVSYPQTFDVRNLADEMDNAQRLSVMNAPKKLRRKQMARLSEKMFPQASEADLKEIQDDIENDWLEEPVIDAASALSAQPTLGKGRVPGKRNSQGENNQGSVKAPDKEKELNK
ncbi:hypothetical protein SAMN03159338_1610 [Sphingomonas sp. NFR04]|uniref:hypothetical protein n=1 Tax=Sphingomonas sp. NFR04 TaxID=1566283 RepID=UPI0008F161C5|nr:hypothetical protein [Sphingomonas sp. NFR04]SFJ50982.1 hypothetical protein SAMN03159338_1610 [Sphingomonas sp. NFR04]